MPSSGSRVAPHTRSIWNSQPSENSSSTAAYGCHCGMSTRAVKPSARPLVSEYCGPPQFFEEAPGTQPGMAHSLACLQRC